MKYYTSESCSESEHPNFDLLSLFQKVYVNQRALCLLRLYKALPN